MDSLLASFWLTPKGIGPRLSDGRGAERTMWATAINLMGWIDVFIRRPVLTWMLILSLVVFGVLGFGAGPASRFTCARYWPSKLASWP